MNFRPRPLFLIPALVLACCVSGCVTQRTVTERGRTVEEGYFIKRPVKNFIENVEVE